ncbi:hypothetical protein TESG_01905 [Trichophyton tonsurans CBS 112818]|uniref:Uncharacterized protein n=1 Tax=Trichophyton tonsurans (strain CBS 112818) TaxID=647933 RepID=F2RST7_TRIT1|nr:hypothetical protein TESG_01905 [Trichophyton tonsurans CBS 112818]
MKGHQKLGQTGLICRNAQLQRALQDHLRGATFGIIDPVVDGHVFETTTIPRDYSFKRCGIINTSMHWLRTASASRIVSQPNVGSHGAQITNAAGLGGHQLRLTDQEDRDNASGSPLAMPYHVYANMQAARILQRVEPDKMQADAHLHLNRASDAYINTPSSH